MSRSSLINPPSWNGTMPGLPWWFRPSRMLIGASLPALLIFSFSDSTLSLSRAQHFYGDRDLLVGVAAIILLLAGALIGESTLLTRRQHFHVAGSRLAESCLTPRFDLLLMAIFLLSHLIFFRGFFLNPGLIAGVLSGNLELKHTFKTIPGVTTWTQVSLLLGAVRGLRWSGVLPGRVKLVSVFHLLFFGTLLVRAVLWSERLALIEGAVPFFVCALPRVARQSNGWGRLLLRFLPLVLPVLLLVVFAAFEYLRSWQSYSAVHASMLEFSWRRLYTYYFEAMNTGAAMLAASGFYDGPTMPLSHAGYEQFYEGLYQGTLDKEYNNVSGIWWVAARMGNLLFAPAFFAIGLWFGATWRAFMHGRFFGLFYPMTFLSLMEIIRIPYWPGLARVLPSTIFIVGLMLWGLTLPGRVRLLRRPTAPDSNTLPHYR